MAQEIINKLDSYSEISPSGTGVKIFVRGKSPFDTGKNKKFPQYGGEGKKEAGIEIYDHGRFFCITGQALPGLGIIKSCNLGWLQPIYFSETIKQSTSPISLPISQPQSNRRVPWETNPTQAPINMSSPAGNDILQRANLYLAQCDPAIQGQGGHDKLLWAAVALVHGFQLSDSQTYDLLVREYNSRCVPPWDLSNSKDEKDFRRKISEARKLSPQKPAGWLLLDNSYAPIDTSGIDVKGLIEKALSKPQEITTSDTADSEIMRPAKSLYLPSNLRSVPGFINEYVSHCMEAAPYPNKPLALAGALALLSTITGRKIQGPTGLGTNLYIVSLAFSGTGKNFTRNLNSQLLIAADAGDLLSERMASSEGIEDRLFRSPLNPVVLFQTDEFDAMIEAMEKGKDARYQAIAALLNELYTASGITFSRRVKAEQNNYDSSQPMLIHKPHVVLHGSAIPQHYYKAVGNRLLQNGFCARTLAIEADSRGKGRTLGAKELPTRLIEEVRYWIKYRPPDAGDLWIANCSTQFTVPATPAAWKMIEACQEAADREYVLAEQASDAGAAAIWSRVNEQMLKLATLYAVSENHLNPRIDRSAVEWGQGVAVWQAKRSLVLTAEYGADNAFQEGCKKFYRIIVALGGKATRRQVSLKMKAPVKTLDEFARALEDQGRIKISSIPISGKIQVIYEAIQA